MKKEQIMKIKEFKRMDKKQYMKLSELQKSCDHKETKKGEVVSTLDPIPGQKGKFRCSICESVVDLNPKSMQVVSDASDTIVEVIQTIKAAAECKDQEIYAQLGFVLSVVEKLPTMYKRQFLDLIDEDEDEDIGFIGGYSNGPVMFSDVDGYKKHHKNNKGKGKKHDKHRNGGKKKKDVFSLMH